MLDTIFARRAMPLTPSQYGYMRLFLITSAQVPAPPYAGALPPSAAQALLLLSLTCQAGLEPAELVFECMELPAARQLPGKVLKRLGRFLGEAGIGFEPDDRFGLPARIRPATKLSLFREEHWSFEEPSEAFHLAQAAIALSEIGSTTFPGLRPLQPADVEACLPFRHRFSDRELRRLEATSLFMRGADEPRALLRLWPRSMKRHQRVSDIDQGFGIAFHAQSGDPLVKRFARAVSIALHADDRRVASFLRAVQAQQELGGGASVASEIATAPGQGHAPSARLGGWLAFPAAPTGSPARKSPVEGLPLGVAEVLMALMTGPCPRKELNAIAVRHQLQVSGALEQINSWSLAKLKAHATRGHAIVRINPDAFEALELLLGSKP